MSLSHASRMPLACLLGCRRYFSNLGNAAMQVQQFAQLLSLAHAISVSIIVSCFISCFSIKPSLNLLGIHFQWHFQLERQGVLHNSNQFTEGFLS